VADFQGTQRASAEVIMRIRASFTNIVVLLAALLGKAKKWCARYRLKLSGAFFASISITFPT
jgi:hypothetical protein